MQVLLIVGIFTCFYWLYYSSKGQKKSNEWYDSEKGCRQVEKEEWERWTKQLCDEYCELSGIAVDFESAGINPYDVEIDYETNFSCKWLKHSYKPIDIFSERPRYKPELKTIPWFTDKDILETLRVRHCLPTESELIHLPHLQTYKDKGCYDSLYGIIDVCVKRAVYRRGYKYNGTDFEGKKLENAKMKATQVKYNYLDNNSKK